MVLRSSTSLEVPSSVHLQNATYKNTTYFLITNNIEDQNPLQFSVATHSFISEDFVRDRVAVFVLGGKRAVSALSVRDLLPGILFCFIVKSLAIT